jgi:DNA-binding CsgD family transcriptional regulator
MNKFKTRYDSLEELYKSHLTKIKNIKFTFREIDLIACIISNKGEKKIASLCDISPRTVSSHVYNIMNKIGCNSKDQIVEFVEFSGKLLVFREYYLHLRVKSYSHKLLAKIGKTNKENINLYVFRSDEAKYPKLFDTLKKDMALANITLEASSEKDQVLSPIIDISEADNNYHMMLFQYINKILDINESISDFDKYYKDIEDMHDGRQSKIASNINIKSIIYKKYFWILILILTGAFIGILGQKNKKEISHNLNRVQEFLALLKDNEIFK